VISFKAAVLRETTCPSPFAKSKPLSIEHCELDPVGPGEVLVRIRSASLCHSDLSVVDGSRPRVMPMVLGHEAAGEVVSLGQGVTDLAPGDRVVCLFVPNCGHCARCYEGRPALCEPGAAANLAGTLLSGARRLHFSANNVPINHHLGVSGFAEYAIVSRSSLVKVPTDLDFETAALFGCAVITGVGAVLNTASVPAGSTVAIVGAGGVGLSCVLGARLAGACRIVVIDLNKNKLKFAQELGAADAFDASSPNLVTKLKEATKGGVDFAFETAGVAPALALAYQITRRGGTTVTAGLPNPNHQFSIPQISLTTEERTLKGSYMGSCVPQRDIPNYIRMSQRGQLPVERLVTHRIQLDEINEGFDLLATGNAGRIVMAI
jgi:alcohol dehydrogenase